MLGLRPDLFRRTVYVSCIAPLSGQTALTFRNLGLPGGDTNATAQPPDDLPAVFKALFCNDMSAEETAAFLGRFGQDAWPDAMYAASDWRYDHLGAVPASFILCLRDAALPVAWQEVFAERFQATRRVRIDAGHQVMNTRPHALAECLRIEPAA